MVNRAGISNLTGAAGEQNFSGEDQKKLDVVSNEVFSNCLRASGRTVRMSPALALQCVSRAPPMSIAREEAECWNMCARGGP